jgi:transcriptional regulator of heat shock response
MDTDDKENLKERLENLSINKLIIENKSNKIFKLDSNTKTFGSQGDRLSHWLFIIKDAFAAQNITNDKDKFTAVTNYLKNNALNTLIRYRNSTENPKWEDFENLLKSQFEDTNLDFKLRTQFFHLKMENSFQRYLTKFQELLNQIPSLTAESEEVHCRFIDGLTPIYAMEVRKAKCKTLNEMIAICNDYSYLTQTGIDNNIESINKITHKQNSYSDFRYNKKPFKNLGKNVENQSKKYNGHNSNITNEKISGSKNFYQYEQNGQKANKCSANSKKVYSVSVFFTNENDNYSLNTWGTINGIPIKMTLDTASTICVISEKVALDKVVAVVGNAIILKSDLEMQYAQYLAQGNPADETLKCYLLQVFIYNNYNYNFIFS